MLGLRILNMTSNHRAVISALLLGVLMCASATAQIAYRHTDVVLHGRLMQGAMIIGETQPSAIVHLDKQVVAVSNEGTFVIGFGRDAQQDASLMVQIKGSKPSIHPLKIQQREYAVQRIDGLDENKVSPPPEVYERIRQDYQLARLAREKMTKMMHFADAFIWPTKGIVTGVYGSARILNNKKRNPHYGIDIAADTGTPVIMPAGGKIVLIHDMYFSGLTMIIDHGYGVFSTLLHLDSVQVKVGDYLQKGAVIAKVGASGRVTGPHLDWRINWFNQRLDPQLLAGEM